MGKKKTLKTVLVFVQDETGSMMSIAEQTRSAFNEYFSTLKKDKKIGDVHASVWQFSDTHGGEDRVRPLHDGPLSGVPQLTTLNYRPRGVTPLLDAVGTAIQEASAKKADRYLFIVQTDGLENASRDFTREQVAAMVAEKEKSDNWTIVFLGAGIANWVNEAHAMGAHTTSSVPYAPAQTVGVYASASVASSSFLRTNSTKGQVAADISKDLEESEKKQRKRTTPKS